MGGTSGSMRPPCATRASPGLGADSPDPWEFLPRLLRIADARLLELLGATDGGLAARLREALEAGPSRAAQRVERLERSVGNRAAAVKEALEGAVRAVLGRTVVSAVSTAQSLQELTTSVLGLELAELIASEQPVDGPHSGGQRPAGDALPARHFARPSGATSRRSQRPDRPRDGGGSSC